MEKSLKELAGDAILDALLDAHVNEFDSLFIGNMMSASANKQQNIGAYIADSGGNSKAGEAYVYDCSCVPCTLKGNVDAVTFLNAVERPSVKVLQSKTIDIELSKFTDSTNYVLAWAMPETWPHRAELGHRFSMRMSQGRLQVFERSFESSETPLKE